MISLTSLLLLTIIAANDGPTPTAAAATASAPKHLLIVAGAREQAAATILRDKAGASRLRVVLPSLGFKLLKSDDVVGLKPGFFVVVAAACPTKEEAERLLDILRADHEDAYLREVEDSSVLPGCPKVTDVEVPNKRYRQVGKGKVLTRAKTLRWTASVASSRNPLFKETPYKGTILRVLSGSTTIDYQVFEPSIDGETSQSFEYKGMVKGLGREAPVIAEAGSWHAGDTCSDAVYIFREGRFYRAALVEDNNCDADLSEWRLSGTIDAPIVTATPGGSQCAEEKPCVLYQSQWDPVAKRYRKGGLEL